MIRNMRIEAGMTQRRLAEAAGVSLRSLQYWEAGDRDVPARALKRVADALGCKVDDLIDDEGNEDEPQQ